MEPMMKVINALTTLTAALQELTEQTNGQYLDTFETICDPPKNSATAADPTPTKAITLPEIRAVLAEKSRAGFTSEVKQLLLKHGAEKLSGIATTEYAALKEEAEQLGS